MDDRDIVRALGGVEASIKSLTAQQDLTRVAVEAQGQRIASLPCRHHQATLAQATKKISDLYRKIDETEDVTGRIIIEREIEDKTKKDGIALWKILVPAAASTIVAIIAALAACGG